MSLWTGLNVNSTETAAVFNRLFNRRSIPMVRKKNGALYAILGKKEVGSEGITGFQRMQKVSGLRIEVKLLGKLKTINTVADGTANEAVTATPTNTQDYWGASEFALAKYADVHAILDSEFDRFRGVESKMTSFIQEVMDMLTYSLEDTWGTALHATGSSKAPSRTVLGSLQAAVSDGVSTGETNYAVYGLADRSSSGNENFRSYCNVATGDLTFGKIRTGKNTTIAAGGNPRVGICHTTTYGKIEAMVDDRTIVTHDNTWNEFGSEHIRFKGITFVLDQRCDSGSLICIDPDSWVWYQLDKNFTEGGIIPAPWLVASHVLNWGCWVQPICTTPIYNFKLTNITS